MQKPCTLAIIAGSGIGGIPAFVQSGSTTPVTAWGLPSAAVRMGTLAGLRALYLPRHGEPHAIAPHRINYRANVQALAALGATHVVAFAAVGGIATAAVDGTLWIPGQIIDYTWGRESSFFDGSFRELRHQEFAEPYDRKLRAMLATAAERAGVAVNDGGVYGCTQGPRLESAAEIARMQRDGCDLVGMTGMPEAVLARELGLPYATLAMVVNRAAGLESRPITLEQIMRVADACAGRMARVVTDLAGLLDSQGAGDTD